MVPSRAASAAMAALALLLVSYVGATETDRFEGSPGPNGGGGSSGASAAGGAAGAASSPPAPPPLNATLDRAVRERIGQSHWREGCDGFKFRRPHGLPGCGLLPANATGGLRPIIYRWAPPGWARSRRSA